MGAMAQQVRDERRPEVDVELVSVSKRFGEVVAVNAVSLAVRQGEFFSLLGPSGCGKTTTLRLIGGFERADAGKVRIAGRSVGWLPPNRRATNMVFQRLALFPHYNAFDNVAFGLRMKHVPDAAVQQAVTEALALVDMAALARRRISELSGGQQQRVAIARALVNHPRVLLLDEPFSSLDLKLRLQMQEELKRLQRELRTTFIYVTHDQGEALSMSDRVGVMDGGRLLQVGPPREIYEMPRTRFVASFIGDANLLDGTLEEAGVNQTVLRIGPWRIVGPAAPGLAPATQATLCLRPERVMVAKQVQATNELSATVEDVAFAGHSVKYRLVAAHGLRLAAVVPYMRGRHVYLPGEPVQAGWDPEQAVLVPPDGTAARPSPAAPVDESRAARRHHAEND